MRYKVMRYLLTGPQTLIWLAETATLQKPNWEPFLGSNDKKGASKLILILHRKKKFSNCLEWMTI